MQCLQLNYIVCKRSQLIEQRYITCLYSADLFYLNSQLIYMFGFSRFAFVEFFTVDWCFSLVENKPVSNSRSAIQWYFPLRSILDILWLWVWSMSIGAPVKGTRAWSPFSLALSMVHEHWWPGKRHKGLITFQPGFDAQTEEEALE